jgi:hypothetical protein
LAIPIPQEQMMHTLPHRHLLQCCRPAAGSCFEANLAIHNFRIS